MVPNIEFAEVAPEKVRDYLLNVQHPYGRTQTRGSDGMADGPRKNCSEAHHRLSYAKVNAIHEHDCVVLTRDIPEEGMRAGDVGTVVHVHTEGAAYEVEFMTLTGATLAISTVNAEHLRPVGARDIAHARVLAEA